MDEEMSRLKTKAEKSSRPSTRSEPGRRRKSPAIRRGRFFAITWRPDERFYAALGRPQVRRRSCHARRARQIPAEPLVIGHEKGRTTESRLKHNFGMAPPEGYRKAVRLMEMAERFSSR